MFFYKKKLYIYIYIFVCTLPKYINLYTIISNLIIQLNIIKAYLHIQNEFCSKLSKLKHTLDLQKKWFFRNPNHFIVTKSNFWWHYLYKKNNHTLNRTP